jgi:integrase
MKKTKPLGQAQPLTVEMVNAISTILVARNGPKDKRNLALLRLSIDTMLRVSDVIRITFGDVIDANGAIPSRITVRQKKTHAVVKCVIGANTRDALMQYINSTKVYGRDQRLFQITPRQVQRIMKSLMSLIHVDGTHYSSHSLRRTKATMIYRETHNVEAVRRLLGHSSIAATSHYLGIQDNDALDLAETFQF